MPGKCWLLKTEPSEYSYADLEAEGRAPWDGVRNAQALGHLRAMETGDGVFIYHSGRERAVVGRGRVVRTAYPDPDGDAPRLVLVDVAAEGQLRRAVTLAALKLDPAFADSPLVRQGRLSVVPLSAAQARRILALSGEA